MKVGAISGRKASTNKGIHWLVKQGTKEMKASYLRAAFDDESCVYKEKTRNCGFITISRYRHLTKLTKKTEKRIKEVG